MAPERTPAAAAEASAPAPAGAPTAAEDDDGAAPMGATGLLAHPGPGAAPAATEVRIFKNHDFGVG